MSDPEPRYTDAPRAVYITAAAAVGLDLFSLPLPWVDFSFLGFAFERSAMTLTDGGGFICLAVLAGVGVLVYQAGSRRTSCERYTFSFWAALFLGLYTFLLFLTPSILRELLNKEAAVQGAGGPPAQIHAGDFMTMGTGYFLALFTSIIATAACGYIANRNR
ncbi:hypothetical protein [Streptomyces sp. NBC_01233]|uniref:hypothetical protein n=1 Tax=Streptomyces sp. NBC_01233 TaxID=2903787 RepID=UPI002E1065EC|nr:hypothetical protein OG332_30135 [Streptomyces sp. NBC_01233]